MALCELKDGNLYWIHVCLEGSVDICKLHPEVFAVTCNDPLSVYPAIGCEECGISGYYSEGQWLPLATTIKR